MVIKKRNVFLVYLFMIITFGIYGIYWYASTRREMNELGAKVPHWILMIVPIANLYWGYKYCEAFANVVKKDKNAVLWFVLWLLVGFVIPGFVQSNLNKLAVANQGNETIPVGQGQQQPGMHQEHDHPDHVEQPQQ
jgi:hypothetical protein